jgi:hypothetical protein
MRAFGRERILPPARLTRLLEFEKNTLARVA